MLLARVTGIVIATRKMDSLVGAKLLTVRPENSKDEIVVVDYLGAGLDDEVIVAQGSAARVDGMENRPIDALIVGIRDLPNEKR
ncbi:MAG: ethanolamine utilization protein EutN [Firmicutes bacterium]|nr:ethanolamine utilization protein EutN [Bacillota bacterium]